MSFGAHELLYSKKALADRAFFRDVQKSVSISREETVLIFDLSRGRQDPTVSTDTFNSPTSQFKIN
jgi:hypothetical protein